MRAKKTKTAIRKDQIVRAALDLIGSKGVQSLSIAGIAKQVGIVPSAIYSHFNGKEDILNEVLKLIKNRFLENVTQARKETPKALDRLNRLLKKQALMLNENRAIPFVIFADGIYTGNPERKTKVAEIMMTFLDMIQKIIEEGRQDGSIREDVVPATAAIMFIGMIMPVAIISNLSKDFFDINEHLKNIWPVFDRSIAANIHFR
ncbi:MAG: TetR/AcrR family transcriptional regulator [Deltaproteobacteria bacterium]|nr:TetR/AcrR family transcriptional regulator [Deltaproteobacteria bacterium]